MPYSTHDQVRFRLPALVNSNNVQPPLYDEGISWADSYINLKLGSIVQVPFTAPIPEAIPHISGDLAAAFVLGASMSADGKKNSPKLSQELYKRGQDWLDMILANSNLVGGVAAPPTTLLGNSSRSVLRDWDLRSPLLRSLSYYLGNYWYARADRMTEGISEFCGGTINPYGWAWNWTPLSAAAPIEKRTFQYQIAQQQVLLETGEITLNEGSTGVFSGDTTGTYVNGTCRSDVALRLRFEITQGQIMRTAWVDVPADFDPAAGAGWFLEAGTSLSITAIAEEAVGQFELNLYLQG